MVNLILAQDDLKEFTQKLAGELRAGDIVLLDGPLGAGKTAFSRALVRALTRDDIMDVQSPTFPICLTYETQDLTVWHYDLYRLTENADLSEFGWDDARREGIAIVEWPQRARPDQFYKPYIRFTIGFTDEEHKRDITIEDAR